MENKRRTNLISVLLILLCLSLSVGATYAYFTDSVTSTGNKIKAGNLKIDLELLDKGTNQWNSIKTSQAPIFDYELWEPGYTDVKLLKVENEGNLAIKWEARFVYDGEISALADVIEVYVKAYDEEPTAYPAQRAELDATWVNKGTLAYFFSNISTILNGELLANESVCFGIELYMPTTVEDNTLQGQTVGEFDIQIVATQLTHESDAFDENYDAGATFPANGTTTPEETTTEVTTPEPDGPTDEPESTDPEIFDWRINDDGTYTCYGINSDHAMDLDYPENLVIPSTYQNIPVTTVDFWWWLEDYITSITIPDSVLTVGGFANLQSLQHIVLGNNVTTINDMAFGVESKITEISIPDSVTYIGFQAFANCSSLTSITFKGTIQQWNAISLGNGWNENIPATEVVCSDGTVALN